MTVVSRLFCRSSDQLQHPSTQSPDCLDLDVGCLIIARPSPAMLSGIISQSLPIPDQYHLALDLSVWPCTAELSLWRSRLSAQPLGLPACKVDRETVHQFDPRLDSSGASTNNSTVLRSTSSHSGPEIDAAEWIEYSMMNVARPESCTPRAGHDQKRRHLDWAESRKVQPSRILLNV